MWRISARKTGRPPVSGRSNTKSAYDWDVVVVGGGHNGLTTAAYLAKAGRRVLVLEKNAVVGGAALTEEFAHGFRNSVASYTAGLLSPKVIADLDLSAFGLRIIERPVPNFWPIDSTRSLLMPYDSAGRQRAVAAFSQRDAESLPAFETMLQTGASIFREVLLMSPPRLAGGTRPLEALNMLSLSRRFLALAAEEKRAVLDLFTKSAAEVLDRWFENTHVKAAFAFDSVVGAYAPPSAPGSAYVLLHHIFGEVNGKRGVWGHVVGGMGAVSRAIADSARAAGAEIETNAAVREITADGGVVTGVALDDGRHLRAKAVAAAVPPKLLFERLLPAGDRVDPDVSSRFRHIRSGSGTFRMNVALSELPDFTCRPGTTQGDHHGAGIIIGPTLEYLEDAYLDARRDGWSARPVIEMLIPSTIDPTLAPEGRHVASLFVQYVAPHLPPPRSWADPREKEAFADLVIATVNAHAPNFARAVIARQVLSPLDLEQRFGLIDGDIFHGQLGLDQLFSMRPVLGYADYRMPLAGLYLCGSGAHPGGGVTGIPGHNAARAILADQTPWYARWRRGGRAHHA